MDINRTAFKRTRSVVMSVQYTGLSMDRKLFASFRNDFRFAFDFQGGGQYLIPEKRGLKVPHTGDWLIFDERGRNLIDIMPDKVFRQTYEKTIRGQEWNGSE